MASSRPMTNLAILPSTIRNQATAYANRGWHVFPVHSVSGGVCSCKKGKDCSESNKGKHPIMAGGHTKASNEPKKVYGLFSAQKMQNANIGIATGLKSKLFVLDIDPRNSGTESLQALADAYPYFAESLNTYCVSTGGGGLHYYFSLDRPFPSIKRHGLGGGIDIKADGGYVVAPPSIHISGNVYRVKSDIPLLPVPDVLWSLLDLPPERTQTSCSEGLIQEGNRNNTLATHASELFRSGASKASIQAKLFEFNAFNCSPPLPDSEVEAIYNSINTRFQETKKSFKTLWQEAVFQSGESGNFVKVLGGLSLWMNSEGRSCYPNLEDIVKRLKVSKPTVIKCIQRAEAIGLLEVYTIPAKTGYSNGYRAKLPDGWVTQW
jgi:Bifunctional DNA primase/polymerase, N-terminal/Primase C terminal 1 (PriCT-1)